MTDEIIIAICGQLGTDLKSVVKHLKHKLTNEFNYETEIITLSDYIFDNDPDYRTYAKKPYERIKKGMDIGNELREKYSPNILADYAVAHIAKSRLRENPKEDSGIGKFSSRRKCFIINSLKHPAEYEYLRLVYGSTLYLLGIFSPYEERVATLKDVGDDINNYNIINTLINRDTGEDIQTGQKVETVFLESDYFIRTFFRDEKLGSRIDKFLNLIFDYGINTPTVEERAMYQATSASVSSACLSRQVGACITTSEGHILSVGWNDVPKFGGGVYPYNDCSLYEEEAKECDKRCLNTGGCKNVERKDLLKEQIVKDLIQEGILNDKEAATRIVEKRLKSLIEFARSIHAEMHAIIVGSQKTGDKMIGGKLFCTTYPCHNCARHIVMAGISEVYYIEPYRKSLCIELHGDSITEKENGDERKVKILMYEGVAPKVFMKFYEMLDNRKQKVFIPEDKKTLSPKHRISLRALHQKEAVSVRFLESKNLIKTISE